MWLRSLVPVECVGLMLGQVLFCFTCFREKLYPVKKETVRKIFEIRIIFEKNLALNIANLEQGMYVKNLEQQGIYTSTQGI